jgi:aminopeptidase
MSLAGFEDFLYGACLIDWDGERERMSRYAAALEGAEEVRVVGDRTDLRVSLAGRRPAIDAGGPNIPGGEFFFSPLEDSAEGTISFSEYPGVYEGREVGGIRLRFESGRVVDASATSNERYLFEVLNRDDGARRVGEFAFGLNDAIRIFTSNILFDEKIGGTVHLALGTAYPESGGLNRSALHWDMICDLRSGSAVYADGELVYRDGRFLNATNGSASLS